MTLPRHDTFRSIGQVLDADVLPVLCHARKLPLCVNCLGTASYDDGDEAHSFDRIVSLGTRQSPEEAMDLAILRVSRGDIHADWDDTLRFRPRIAVIQDSEYGLVLAGEVRAGIILWRQPVATEAEARRVVTDASRLRGMAFAASGRAEHGSARDLRYRASLLEARLVDAFWRETATDLLRLPQAA